MPTYQKSLYPINLDALHTSAHAYCHMNDRAVADPRVACKQKQAHLALIKQVSNEKAALQKEELAATLSGRNTSDIELRLENAREMRKLLMQRLKLHITEHGC
jgi:hypothetical protein